MGKTLMNKLFLAVFFLIVLGCSRNFDHSNVYRIIQEKFPQDEFIKQSIEKAKEKDPEISTVSPFDIDFFKIEPDPLDLIIYESINDLNSVIEKGEYFK